ncbi:Fe-S cluster assembly sulfur transfer protein SufU [Arthrobacter roseus]|uniref:Fe-S cluster assembly sulfur transfer protein SufU n=1 Tax=Arthrobacter roseus TaxID=136274 RepID=UPI001963A9A4|nr:SUF system NifU family Fe-S cluster assembly protein [Arthrobacter roseus]MBM7848047.1 nitrogen fixation NifU-like protein [Arthrobacter roseus]
MAQLDQLYQQIILDHAKERHGRGLIDPEPGHRHGESHQLNPVCGDEITLRTCLDHGTITSLTWEGDGCAISQASASILADLGPGLTRDDLIVRVDAFRDLMRSRGKGEADEELLGDAAALTGVSRFPARVKCAMLAWVALEEALLAAN